MQITIDTNNLSDLDIAMLSFLAGQEAESEPVAAAVEDPAVEAKVVGKKAPAKAAPAPEPQPEPEPEVEEDLLGGTGPTLSDAIARATTLVSEGGTAKVKAALAALGVAKVSGMTEDQVPAFFAALDAAE